MNATTVSLIESGRLKPYDSQRQKLAAALGIAVDEITAMDRIPEPSQREIVQNRERLSGRRSTAANPKGPMP